MSELLQVRDLSIEYVGKRIILDSISFSIATGERVGLIGESGSGKSITALAASGLLPNSLARTGNIVFDGIDVLTASDRTLKKIRGARIGMVFQDPSTSLDPLMKIGRQVAQPLKRHLHLSGKELEDAVFAALHSVRLADVERISQSYPHEISGGERQRVAIACALAGKPDLLIADEPTTALDVTVQGEILLLLNELVTQRGMALLFISHDLAVISQVVSRVIVMQSGHIVEDAPLDSIVNSPQHHYTRSLLHSARILDSVLRDI